MLHLGLAFPNKSATRPPYVQKVRSVHVHRAHSARDTHTKLKEQHTQVKCPCLGQTCRNHVRDWHMHILEANELACCKTGGSGSSLWKTTCLTCLINGLRCFSACFLIHYLEIAILIQLSLLIPVVLLSGCMMLERCHALWARTATLMQAISWPLKS